MKLFFRKMQRRNFFLQFFFISFLQSATPFPAPRGVAEERPLERAAQSRTPGLIEDFQNLGNNIFGLFSQGLGRPRRPNPFNQFNQNQIQSKVSLLINVDLPQFSLKMSMNKGFMALYAPLFFFTILAYQFTIFHCTLQITEMFADFSVKRS